MVAFMYYIQLEFDSPPLASSSSLKISSALRGARLNTWSQE